MGNHAVFMRKLKEYESLIRYASKRYQIKGVLDPDDLYQEGLCILDGMFRKYDFDPESEDFRKMFKTELWHGLWKVLQKYKTKKRDWKKIVSSQDYSQLENRAGVSNRYGTPPADDGLYSLSFSLHSPSTADGPTDRSLKLGREPFSAGINPEERLETIEEVEDVDRFIDMLVYRLDDEARVVLSEMLYPRTWDEIPDEYKSNGCEDEYWRVPKKIPQHVLARMLDWPLIRVRRSISRIRKQAALLGEELNLPLIAAAFKKRKKRKKYA